MKSLLIIGAGEYGQLVKELAESCGYNKIDFLDDKSPLAIGMVSEAKKWKNVYTEFIVAIGNPDIREKIVESLEEIFRLATLVHPSAYVSKSAIIENGCIVEPNVVIQSAAMLGKACIVNAGAVINHNSMITAYSQMDCNAVVAARAFVPKGTKVMSGTVWTEQR